MEKKILLGNITRYKFELKHLTVLFLILLLFQFSLSIIQKSSIQEFVDNSKEWFQKNSTENLANLTATSLELFIENINVQQDITPKAKRKIIDSFNILISQQLLLRSVEELYVVISKEDKSYIIDNGDQLYTYLKEDRIINYNYMYEESDVLKFYKSHIDKVQKSEIIYSEINDHNTFYTLVMLVPHGEFLGALVIKNKPDLGFITAEIITGYTQAAVIYSALIILGLMAMYYISSYTVRERDEAQSLLLVEHENHLKEQIEHEKESQFTKRIYHAHHKAEKIIGFMREDLRILAEQNIEEIKARINKYANFVSRVIYDMKSYDPPVHTYRGPLFSTNMNEVIVFLVDNLFRRISSNSEIFKFEMNFDDRLPPVQINEFIVWEVIEPIIQNSFDHRGDKDVTVSIKTEYIEEENISHIIISDNGTGIAKELLEPDENNVKKIFLENITTKKTSNKNSGYGCFIAYQITKYRCGWHLDVKNNEDSGCSFIITIKN